MSTVSLPFQPSLVGSGDPVADPSFSTLRRVRLDAESWVDLAPGWLAGPDTLFAQLANRRRGSSGSAGCTTNESPSHG